MLGGWVTHHYYAYLDNRSQFDDENLLWLFFHGTYTVHSPLWLHHMSVPDVSAAGLAASVWSWWEQPIALFSRIQRVLAPALCNRVRGIIAGRSGESGTGQRHHSWRSLEQGITVVLLSGADLTCATPRSSRCWCCRKHNFRSHNSELYNTFLWITYGYMYLWVKFGAYICNYLVFISLRIINAVLLDVNWMIWWLEL